MPEPDWRFRPPQIAEMVPVRRGSSGLVVASTAAAALDADQGALAVGDVIHAVTRLIELRAALAALNQAIRWFFNRNVAVTCPTWHSEWNGAVQPRRARRAT